MHRRELKINSAGTKFNLFFHAPLTATAVVIPESNDKINVQLFLCILNYFFYALYCKLNDDDILTAIFSRVGVTNFLLKP